MLRDYGGRPTPVTECHRLSERLGIRVLLKREDLAHTGSHKINNVIGQALITERMGKRRMIAETGAGQHGVATATAAALFGFECRIYMGEVDVERQALNVFRMKLLGAEVIPVSSGSRTLKDAINETLREWVASVESTHYCLGSVMGPHPYPWMVREFQRIVGEEAAEQCRPLLGGGRSPTSWWPAWAADRTPPAPSPASSTPAARLVGRRARGRGRHRPGRARASSTAASRSSCRTRTARSSRPTPSPPVSTTRAWAPSTPTCPSIGRVRYVAAGDAEVLRAFRLLAETEGIIPALEPAHALAWVIRAAGTDDLPPGCTVLVTLSGRGDKDVAQVMEMLDL